MLSTGGSALKAVEAVKAAGGDVIGVVAIFSYQLPALDKNFEDAGLPYYTVTNYTTLIETAKKNQMISDDQLASLHAWRKDPEKWSQEHGE